MKFYGFVIVSALLLQVCTALIDPISLSAVGAVTLAYFGLSAAAWGTLAAAAGAGLAGSVLMVNQKLKEEGLPELNESGDALLICTQTGISDSYSDRFLYSSFCNHVVKGHQDCGIRTGSRIKHNGVISRSVCAAADVNSTSSLHHYQTVWPSAKCKLARRDSSKPDFSESSPFHFASCWYKHRDM